MTHTLSGRVDGGSWFTGRVASTDTHAGGRGRAGRGVDLHGRPCDPRRTEKAELLPGLGSSEWSGEPLPIETGPQSHVGKLKGIRPLVAVRVHGLFPRHGVRGPFLELLPEVGRHSLVAGVRGRGRVEASRVPHELWVPVLG